MSHVTGQLIEPQTIQRILICRINERLGNNLFLTPLLANLARLMPQAQIDLLLSRSIYNELLQPFPNVKQSYIFSREHYRAPHKIIGLSRQLRKQNYDLAIDPGCISHSGRFSMLLNKAKIKLGFTTGGKRYELTHTLLPTDKPIHDSHRPLELLQKFHWPEPPQLTKTLTLSLSDEERRHGHQLLAAVEGLDINRPIVGLFCDAAGQKKIAATWWQQLVEQLQQQAPQVQIAEIISANQTQAMTNNKLPTIQQSQLRTLASVLSHLTAFISADTGPMHLATASGAATIGLFNATNPQQFAPQGERDAVIDVNHLSVAEVVKAIAIQLKSTAKH